MANFQNQIPSEVDHHVLCEKADAEAFIEEFCRECAAFVLDEPIPSTIFRTATDVFPDAKETRSIDDENRSDFMKNNQDFLDPTSTMSVQKEAVEDQHDELEDDHVNGCKGTGVFIPRGTAICMQKSNPIKDIAAFSQPRLADPYYDEKMKEKDKKKTISMEKQVVEKDDDLYIQVSADIRLPVEWPYEEYS